MNRTVLAHAKIGPSKTFLHQTYRSAGDCLVAVGQGLTGWCHMVDGELQDCATGDLALAVFFRELDALYGSGVSELADLLKNAAQKTSTETPGSSVVSAAVLFSLDSSSAQLSHAGDCRVYLSRNQRMIRLTQDHTVIAELLHTGKISDEQARISPFKMFLTRVAGPEMDQTTVQLEPDDRLFLCTAGLWRMIDEMELQDALSNHSDPFEFIESLCLTRDAGQGWAAAVIDLN